MKYFYILVNLVLSVLLFIGIFFIDFWIFGKQTTPNMVGAIGWLVLWGGLCGSIVLVERKISYKYAQDMGVQGLMIFEVIFIAMNILLMAIVPSFAWVSVFSLFLIPTTYLSLSIRSDALFLAILIIHLLFSILGSFITMSV